MFTFTDVLPFPNRSYAAPIRGVMSWKPVTPSCRGKMKRLPNRLSAVMPFSPSGNQLHACSYRTAPCSVRRPCVH